VILQFRFLSAFEGEELMEWEKITMIFGAGVDGDVVGNDVVGDARHRFLANGAGDGWVTRVSIFGSNGVEVLGGDRWDKIGDEGGDEVTTAVETFVNQGILIIRGDNFLISKSLVALRTNHRCSI